MCYTLQKPRQYGTRRLCRMLQATLLCILCVLHFSPFCNAALSETEVVPTSDILLVNANYFYFPLNDQYFGWLQTLCLMNGAYPLAVFNTGTRDNVRSAMLRDGRPAAILGGYSHAALPSARTYIVPPTSGTTTFTWVNEDYLFQRYGTGKIFWGNGVNAPYTKWSLFPTPPYRLAFLMATSDPDMAAGAMASGGTFSVACRKSSTPPLDEGLASSIVLYDVVRFTDLAVYLPSTLLQCAARGMRLMQPSDRMREFALEAAVLRNTATARQFILVGGGYDASSDAWKWHDERETPTKEIFTVGLYSTRGNFREQTYANWQNGYPQDYFSGTTPTLGLARSYAWQNFETFTTSLMYSVACEPPVRGFTNKGLYAVKVPTPSITSPSVAKALCMLNNTSGEAATIMSQTENDELLRVMIRTGIPLAEQQSGSLMLTVPHILFMLGATRKDASTFTWDNFNRSATPMAYLPAAISGVSSYDSLAASPIQLPWLTTSQTSLTHVVCQPSAITPAAEVVITIRPFNTASRVASVADGGAVSVSAAEAAACGPGAAPMIVATAAQHKALEAAMVSARFADPSSPTLPSDDTFAYLNAVSRGGAWVWGDGTPVSFAMWDPSAAVSAAPEGQRLVVVLTRRGWIAAPAPSGSGYVACMSCTNCAGGVTTSSSSSSSSSSSETSSSSLHSTLDSDSGGSRDGEGGGNTGGNTDNNDGGDDKKGGGLPWWVYLIIGIAAGAVVIAVVLTIVLCCCGCCGCCPCAPNAEDDTKDSSHGHGTGSDRDKNNFYADDSPATHSRVTEGRHSSRSAPAADSSTVPKSSSGLTTPPEVSTAAQTGRRLSQQRPAPPVTAPLAANPYVAPPPAATPAAEEASALPPPLYELNSDSNVQQLGSFHSGGAEGAAVPRRRLSRRSSVTFVPPSQNNYAQTSGNLSHVFSDSSGGASEDNFFTDL